MPLFAQHPRSGDHITANLTAAAWVISPRYGVSYSFDHAGRLLSLFRDERSCQRTLDHRLLERRPNSANRRHELPPADSEAVLAAVFDDLRDLAGIVPDLALDAAQQRTLSDVLETILAFGPPRLTADGARFRALYKPVSILPPDQYLALVLQATEGCSWNRCTFCGLYRDRPFRILTPDQFRAHCQAVQDFYGAGLSLRRGIFLADANALIMPQRRLLAIMAIAQGFFGQPDAPRAVHSFVSAFDVGRKSAEDWAALAALGLKRAYIGLETGDDDLLRFLNKPGTAQDAIDAVHALRAGGVAVGVILMAGIGGERYAETHVARSVEALQTMQLGPRDQVYISHYMPAPDTEYPDLAAAAGIRALAHDEVVAQMQTLQTRARAAAPSAKVAPYHVQGFAL